MLYIGGLNYRQRNEAKQKKTKHKNHKQKQRQWKMRKTKRYVCKFDTSNKKINNQNKQTLIM